MGQLNHLPEIQENIMGGGVAIDHRLVGGIATPLKNMKVSWMILPNVWKNKQMFQSPPTRLTIINHY